MPETVYWKGNPFWRKYDLEALQSLARKTIFTSQLSDQINLAHRGDIIPVPDLPTEELITLNDSSSEQNYDHSPSGEQDANCSPASKASTELVALMSCTPPKPPRRSPLDERIAELEASIAAEGASRLSASPKILHDLRPELPPRSSPLSGKTGITRLPGEITRGIIACVESRADLSVLSRVSKTWRHEALPTLYSALILRGWDEILPCLATLSMAEHIANLVIDLTLDCARWPPTLNETLYFIAAKALDKTRRLRRLALMLDSDQSSSFDVSIILSQCRFRLHDFVYEGCTPAGSLEDFLDFQSNIRTLQLPDHTFSRRDALSGLPPNLTHFWLTPSNHFPDHRYEALTHLSHLSVKGEMRKRTLAQFRQSPIHYLALDVAPWIISGTMLPSWFGPEIPMMFSNLRTLRLVAYWVVCETTGPIVALQQPSPAPDNFMQPNGPQQHEENIPAPGLSFSVSRIGQYFEQDNQTVTNERDLATTPTLQVESGFYALLVGLPTLQALEIGGFVVRDAGKLRHQAGHARHWVSLRTRWEEEFIHRVVSRSAKNLLVVSFLACDKPLFSSLFRGFIPNFPCVHRLWAGYLQRAKERVARETEETGITISNLVFQAGVPRSSESSMSDRELNLASAQPALPRDLLEDVVTSEWVKVGSPGQWKKRVNVRNLRDIWPSDC
ncbi:hypothetical protein BDV93DRAFT_542311 [Ceratobasidium sp. AG-I]|nr:hypothetical protein BDV93DRAFT_542311 [Ceratobasidium sp. AG-I]